MSYKNANLYASRVYGEHPVVLWSFDEDITFYSLISTSQKEISATDWTFASGVSSSVSTIAGNPIDGSPMDVVNRPSSAGSTMYMNLTSSVNSSNFDEQKGSFCFSTFAYIQEATFELFDSIDIGVIVNGSANYSTNYQKDYFFQDRWVKIEHTENTSGVSSFSPFIRVNFSTSVSGESSKVVFAGVSCGQWSEQYNYKNTGADITTIPSSITSGLGYPSLNGIAIDPYGFDDSNTGYVLEYDKRILAAQSGIPMTYGSKSNISIFHTDDFLYYTDILFAGDSLTTYYSDSLDLGSPSSTYTELVDGGTPEYFRDENSIPPSILLKSNGFLNESGSYSNLTAEFWMKINTLSSDELKIMGPLNSQDGLYVDRNYLTVKIGKYKKSYFVGQWYRPMLIHFMQSQKEISLMINAEKVISILLDSDGLNGIDLNSSQLDYLGFFGHENIPQFEISSFAIYPYVVSQELAKKRFVYGQGVDEYENLAYSNKSDVTYLDFPFAKYDSTISLPNSKLSWNIGYHNNLKVSNEGIELPEYTVPELIFTNVSTSSESAAQEIWSNFETDNYAIQDDTYPFIKMSPNSNYSNIQSTLYVTNLNRTDSSLTRSIHAYVKTSSGSSGYTDDQSILYFTNLSTTDYFDIRINSGSIQYLYNADGVDSILYSHNVSSDEYVSVGIKFDDIVQSFPEIGTFFDNLERVALNVGGVGNRQFLGNIYSITINDEFYSDKDSDIIFNANGTSMSAGFQGVFDYVGAYTIRPVLTNTSVYLDVAASGYWESSFPLTYFGKYINTSSGSLRYDLDMIQFNIDVPSIISSASTSLSETYFDDSNVKVYLTLQSSASVGEIPYTDYINTTKIRNGRILDFDSVSGSANTKFEICDGTVIYPPKTGTDFNDYSITVHLEVTSYGVNTESLKVKKMSLASASQDETSLYTIKTPTGRTVNPIAKSGSTTLYKQDIPFVINTESSPYLYVNGFDGISTISQVSSSVTTGVSFLINENRKDPFDLVGLQMNLMYNKSLTFSGSVQIGSFYNTEPTVTKYDIYLVPENDNQRAFIKIYNSSTNVEVKNAKYYLNGNFVSKVPIKPLEWNFIVISMPDAMRCVPGYLDIYSGITINNVAFFDEQRSKSTIIEISDSWLDVLNTYGTWTNLSASTWYTTYNPNFISTGNYVDGESVSETYYGISSFIGDDSDTLSVNFDNAILVNDIKWSSFEVYSI